MPIKEELIWAEASTWQWYRKFESFMTDNGYHKTSTDHYVFVNKFKGGHFLILLLYVDDMLIVRHDHMKI